MLCAKCFSRNWSAFVETTVKWRCEVFWITLCKVDSVRLVHVHMPSSDSRQNNAVLYVLVLFRVTSAVMLTEV